MLVMDEKLPILRRTDDCAPGSHVVKMLPADMGALPLLPPRSPFLLRLLLLLMALTLPLFFRRLPSMMNMTAMTTRAATLPTTGAAIHACELVLSCAAAALSASEGPLVLFGVGTGITVVMGMVRTLVMATFSEVETDVITEMTVWVVTASLVMLGGGLKNDGLSLGRATGTTVLVY